MHELKRMRKEVIQKMEEKDQFEHDIDKIVEKMVYDNELKYDSPKRKKNSYKKFRIFSEPSSPRK